MAFSTYPKPLLAAMQNAGTWPSKMSGSWGCEGALARWRFGGVLGATEDFPFLAPLLPPRHLTPDATPGALPVSSSSARDSATTEIVHSLW